MNFSIITKYMIVISLFLIPITAVNAQTWRQFTTSDGLAGDRVSEILEVDGELWVGTNAGLSQFSRLSSSFFINHLAGKAITSLEFSDGEVWAGTDNGLWQYRNTGWEEHLAGEIITSLASSDGDIWAGTDNGLWQYNKKTGIWKKPDHLAKENIISLLDTDKYIWVGTSKALWQYDKKSQTWEEKNQEGPSGAFDHLGSSDGAIWAVIDQSVWQYDGKNNWQNEISLPGRVIGSLLVSDTDVWVGTDQSLWQYNNDQDNWHEHLKEKTIYSLASSDQNIWVGTYSGLWQDKYNKDTHNWEEHLAGKFVRYVLASSDNEIWAGTSQGLWHYSMETVWARYLTEDINSLASSDESIWAGTDEGLRQYDKRAQIWRKNPEELAVPEELKKRMPITSLASSDGNIWIGTGNGLWQYNENNKNGEKYLPKEKIRYVWTPSDGGIWVALHEVLLQYNKNDDHWNEHLMGKAVYSLISSNGVIWAGTNQGLCQYDEMADHWHELGQPQGNRIYSLASSGESIWAGTDQGLWQYNMDSGWAEQGHLVGMRIKSLLALDGHIWAGIDGEDKGGGLWHYSNETGWREFSRLDSLLSNNVNIIIEDRHGSLWIGTKNGVVNYTFTKIPPSIRITKVDGEPPHNPYMTGENTTLIEWEAIDRETETYSLIYQYKQNKIDDNGRPIDDNGWSSDYLNNFLNTSPVEEDGKYKFYVRAIDSDFNYSEATLLIDVDTIQPIVVISSPTRGAFVGKDVPIRGRVEDKDLKEFWIGYAEGEDPRGGHFKEIPRSSKKEFESGLIANWDTRLLIEMEYTIRVQAIDSRGHTRDDTITVTVDKTFPIVSLTKPACGTCGAQLGKQTQITGEVSDAHLDRYLLQYTTESDPNTDLWRTIFQETDLLQAHKTKIQIERVWEIPTDVVDKNIDRDPPYLILLRLTASDAAGNSRSQTVSVEIPKIIKNKEGGYTRSSDDMVSLYIPPNSLPEDIEDTIVTINPVLEAEMQHLDVVYDLKPDDLKFRDQKPATLTISYRETIPDGKQMIIFKWKGGAWEALGGAVTKNEKDQTVSISIAVNELGRFALMEVEKFQPDDSARILSLTSQPRAFSPRGGTYSYNTNISFTLDKPATVTVKVYNVAGRLVKLVAHEQPLPKGRNVFLWNGKDDKEEEVPVGPYIIAVTAGNQTETKVVSVYDR